MSNSQNGSASWLDKSHQLEFTSSQLELLRTAVDNDKGSLLSRILDLAVDNNSIKVKSVEAYSSYTISFTFDKHHPEYPGHNLWFYDTDAARGIRVMSLVVTKFLEEFEIMGSHKVQRGLW